ncbi:MAG: FAD-dependent oxidoreductase [Candidatus Eremiobacteraeota bacterium]|nr:FAD-dependent oxidoreductase [Candidatus Eremiobacteraeota bacterium]
MSLQEPALVVIGGGAAGLAAAVEAARWQPGRVLVLDQAPVLSVGTCGLPYLVGGQIGDAQKLLLHSRQELEERGLRLFTECRLESIDLANQRLHYRDLARGQNNNLPFQNLLLAPGGRFDFPGGHLKNVLAPRDLVSSLRARAWLRQPECRRVLVVGAGYLGLELAEAARFAGKQVTLLDPCSRILGLVGTLHDTVLRELARHGVEWRQHEVMAWEGERRAQLRDGSVLDFDLALLATGVSPRHPLLEGLALERGPLGGLRVDRQGRTSRARIWAAGDCCEIPPRQGTRPVYLPLARPAALLGRAAGAASMGQSSSFAGCVPCASVKVFELEVGWVGAMGEGDRYLSDGPLRAAYWSEPGRLQLCLEFCPRSRRLLGAQAVASGEVTSLLQTLALAIDQGLDFEALSDLDHPYTPPLSGMWNGIARTVRSSKRWA